MSDAPLIEDLAGIQFVNGINHQHEGFVTVRAVNNKHTILLIGQSTPDEIRQHGLAALESAVWADYEACLVRSCHAFMSDNADAAESLATNLIQLMRAAKAES